MVAAALVAAALVAFVAVVAVVRYAPLVDDVLSMRGEFRTLVSVVADKGHDLDAATLETLRGDARRIKARQARVADALSHDPVISAARVLPLTAKQVAAADELVGAAGLLLGVVDDGLDVATRFVAIRDKASGSSKLEALVGLAADSHDDLVRASAAVDQALRRLDAIPDDAVGQIVSARDEARDELRRYRPLLSQALDASAFVPAFMGWDHPTRYLVLLQDPAELRPTGGYIGQYGLVVFDHGRIVEKAFHDIATLYELKGLPYIAPPAPLRNHLLGPDQSWRLADSNWSPDFPTSAQVAFRMFAIEGKGIHVDGVIALTTLAIDDLLTLTGPIDVPGYDAHVRPGKATLDILAVTRARPGPGDRKAILGPFADQLLAQLMALPSSRWGDLPAAFEAMRAERNAAIWLTDPSLQSTVVDAGWSGALPELHGDQAVISEASVAPVGKLHLVTDRDIDLDVTVDDAGTAHALLALHYDNHIRDTPDPELQRAAPFLRANPERDDLGVYVRVLAPPTAQVGEVSVNSGDRSIGGLEAIEEELGRKSFGAYVLLPPGKTALGLGWVTPNIVETLPDGRFRYTLSVPKPPGRLDDPLRLVIRLPPGAHVVELSDPNLQVGTDEQNAPVIVLSEPFRQDVQISVTYTISGSG
jgi:hypothetical protein